MKAALFLIAAGLALCQDQGPVIADALDSITAATNSLNDGVTAFDGPEDIESLQSTADAVLSEIATGTTAVDALPGNIGLEEAFSITGNVRTLGEAVSGAVENAIGKKSTFASACAGVLVLENLQSLQSAASDFANLIRGKLEQDDAILEIADGLIAPINDALAQAVSEFSDQTSLPAECGDDAPAPTSESSSAPAPTSGPTAGPSSVTSGPAPTSGAPSSAPTPTSFTGAAMPTGMVNYGAMGAAAMVLVGAL